MLFAGCTGASDWHMLAAEVGDGVLLSAWSDGDDAILVGGDLAGGPGVLARYDGRRLCTRSAVTERSLWWVHGREPGDWWAVGEGGTALHSVQGVETRVDVPTERTLYGVYDDGEQVWAVGGDPFEDTGEIWRHDGSEWTSVAAGLPGVVFKVWNGWFVGTGVAYHWDGAELVEVPTSERLLTVRGRDDTDVWAVGGSQSATVLHHQDGSWVPFQSADLGQGLNGVWTGPGETVWVAGNFGMAAFWDEAAAAWQFASPPVTAEHLHAVWPHQDDMLFVGGNLFAPGGNHGTILRYGPRRGDVAVQDCD